jgi:FMN phosphatase YigB (HAD superfamily)
VRTTVVFDVGETLVDETEHWAAWAHWLGVPEFTLYGVLGGLAARGEDHRQFVELLKPGLSFEGQRLAKDAAGRGNRDRVELYPDVPACLAAVKADGWTIVVGGNQPATFQGLVERWALPVDLVTSSGSLGADKPDPAFFRAIAATVGVDPTECIHVGDRVDNDIVAARAAGMATVHVRRGPWGVLHADDPAIEHQVTSLTELPELLRTLR